MSPLRALSFAVALATLSHVRLVGSSRVSPRLPANEPAMFRGDAAHTGQYTGGGRSLIGLAWRAPTDGDVISSPTIANGTVYVGSGDGHLYALDLATGVRRWRYDAGSGVSSSPAVGQGLVFAVARDGSAFAVDAATGARRWRMSTGPDLALPWGHESGDHYLSSPALVGSTLIFGAGDGGVYAVDARTGRVKWHARTGGRVRSSPAIADGRVYVGSYDGRVYSFDVATGAERWRFDTEGTTLKSGSYGFDRRSIQSSPAVMNGVVYIGARDGFLYAIDAASGKQRWRYDHKVSWIITSPAVSKGVIYAGSSDAHFLQALDATGKELWRFASDVPVWSSPSVAGDVVYVGDGAGRLHAVDRATGKEQWFFRSGSQVYSSPAIAGGLVVFGSTDGGVYALRASDGPAVSRAVFFDSSYARATKSPQTELLLRYMVNRGYRALDTAALATFFAERIADRAPSVVVFAVDYLPPGVLEPSLSASLVRRYLNAGGKIVWTGGAPLVFAFDPKTGRYPEMSQMNWAAPGTLLGVPHDDAIFDQRGVRATPEGARWGMPPRWRAAWSVAPAGVSDVLGLDEWGLAAAWVKNYGGPPGTGFVRVPAEEPLPVYLAAERR
jgi:eukaryotic-like serine/threonine-protein kinase